jgi:hypothetical protein
LADRGANLSSAAQEKSYERAAGHSRVVVDDHDLFRDGVVSLIHGQPDMEVVGEAGDGLEGLVLAQSLRRHHAV